MSTPLDHIDLLFFSKAPRPGEVKTRLARDIGHDAAAALHASFVKTLSHTIERFVTSAPDEQTRHAILARADARHHPLFDDDILGVARETDWQELVQRGASLGERLATACEQLSSDDEARRGVLIIGSDSPTLDTRHFEAASRALDSHDVVIGPSFDGGYYLIGLANPDMTGVFEKIAWSTPDVLGQTMARCRELELSVTLIEFWYDVDTFEDLELMRTHLCDYLVASPAGQHYSEVVEQLNALVASSS